ncbi:MAG TPA: DUF4931 domain-containing protein [Stenomitos sp.]
MTRHLRYNANIGRQKPENIVNRQAACPFCERDKLVDILAEAPPLVLLKNKYPVLEDAYQTVIIETEDCDAEFSEYAPEHLHRVVRFGLEHWQRMIRSGEFESVLFFKNHGPHSGGTIRHPHSQIVGLHHLDYRAGVEPHHFEGIPIDRRDGIEFNVSTLPRMGFTEFNVVLSDWSQVDQLADYVQIAAHYVLNHFHARCNSYNLFFYEHGEGVAAKLIPRFVVSPLFVGFAIPQVSSRVDEIAQTVRDRYLEPASEPR